MDDASVIPTLSKEKLYMHRDQGVWKSIWLNVWKNEGQLDPWMSRGEKKGYTMNKIRV